MSHDDGERRPPRALLEAAISGVQAQSTTTSILSLDETLTRLQHAIAVPRSDRAHIRTLLERIDDISLQRGLTSTEATRVARLALRGAGTRIPATAVSVRLIKAIRPAYGQIFGHAFVLAILGSLGGAGDHVVDRSGLRLAVEELADGPEAEDDDDEDDEDNGAGSQSGQEEEAGASTGAIMSVRPAKLRRRKRIDVRVQGMALRLLVLLLAPPSSLLRAPDRIGEGSSQPNTESRNSSQLPPSLLSAKARSSLVRCYGVLFHYLEYQTLRPFVCHLLCTLTRRKHVKHYRVMKLLSLRAQLPHDTHLAGLLRMYARHVPDLVFATAAASARSEADDTSTSSGLHYPDVHWLLGVADLWQGRPYYEPDDGSGERRGKRSRTLGSVPGSRPANQPATFLASGHQEQPITTMGSYVELGYYLNSIKLPDHVSTALTNSMIGTAILAAQESVDLENLAIRIDAGLISAFSDEVGLHALEVGENAMLHHRPESSRQRAASLLAAGARWLSSTGGMTPRLQNFIVRLLQPEVWRGMESSERREILRLATLLTPCQTESLSGALLAALCHIALDAESALEAADVLLCFAEILHQWSQRDWAALIRNVEAEQPAHWGPTPLSADEDVLKTANTFTKTAADLSVLLLQRHSSSIAVEHVVLRLYETILQDSLLRVHRETLPHQMALYRPLFSPFGAIMSLSRIFSILQTVRELHQDYLAAKIDGGDSPEKVIGHGLSSAMQRSEDAFFAEASSDAINDCVILFVDLVWRNSGFASVEAGNDANLNLSANFFEKLKGRCQGRGDELERMGSASHSAHLAVLMEAYANHLANHHQNETPADVRDSTLLIHGPVTPVKLKGARVKGFPSISHRDFRDGFLTALADGGAAGIRGLLNATVTRFLRGQFLDESTILG